MAVVYQWWAWYWAAPSHHCLYSAIMCVCVYFLTISTTQDTLILTSFYKMIADPCFHGTRWPTIDINVMFIMVLLKRSVQLQVEHRLIVGNTWFCSVIVPCYYSFFNLHFICIWVWKAKEKGLSWVVERERSCSVKSLLVHVSLFFLCSVSSDSFNVAVSNVSSSC